MVKTGWSGMVLWQGQQMAGMGCLWHDKMVLDTYKPCPNNTQEQTRRLLWVLLSGGHWQPGGRGRHGPMLKPFPRPHYIYWSRHRQSNTSMYKAGYLGEVRSLTQWGIRSSVPRGVSEDGQRHCRHSLDQWEEAVEQQGSFKFHLQSNNGKELRDPQLLAFRYHSLHWGNACSYRDNLLQPQSASVRWKRSVGVTESGLRFLTQVHQRQAATQAFIRVDLKSCGKLFVLSLSDQLRTQNTAALANLLGGEFTQKERWKDAAVLCSCLTTSLSHTGRHYQ